MLSSCFSGLCWLLIKLALVRNVLRIILLFYNFLFNTNFLTSFTPNHGHRSPFAPSTAWSALPHSPRLLLSCLSKEPFHISLNTSPIPVLAMPLPHTSPRIPKHPKRPPLSHHRHDYNSMASMASFLSPRIGHPTSHYLQLPSFPICLETLFLWLFLLFNIIHPLSTREWSCTSHIKKQKGGNISLNPIFPHSYYTISQLPFTVKLPEIAATSSTSSSHTLSSAHFCWVPVPLHFMLQNPTCISCPCCTRLLSKSQQSLPLPPFETLPSPDYSHTLLVMLPTCSGFPELVSSYLALSPQ